MATRKQKIKADKSSIPFVSDFIPSYCECFEYSKPTMKYLTLSLLILSTACQTAPKLPEGRWNGSLTPMNHPDMQNQVAYNVSYESDKLQISLIGPNNSTVDVQNPRIEGDTLFFAFNEPEEHVLLRCALVGEEADGFAGRCTAPSGKWAHFTMRPPR